MWDVEKTYSRVDQALANGELWRAKEILQGNIGVQDYDPDLYERYGRLLLQMGDLVEAGKYLFLSAARRGEYEQAIELYLSKHGRGGPSHLYASLPTKAKFTSVDDYPASMRAQIEALGLSEHLTGPRQARTAAPQSRGIALIMSSAVIAFLLCSCVVGLVVIVKWVLSLIAG